MASLLAGVGPGQRRSLELSQVSNVGGRGPDNWAIFPSTAFSGALLENWVISRAVGRTSTLIGDIGIVSSDLTHCYLNTGPMKLF